MTFSNPITTLVFVVLIGLLIWFGIQFIIPALRGNSVLDHANQSLRTTRDEVQASGLPLGDLSSIAEALDTNLLVRPWTEFRDTLHEQRLGDTAEDEDDDLISPSSTRRRYRQTAPAREFFSYEALVETPLRTEVFKHLPGILTALGIIGTFSGVIFGLADFSVADAQTSLTPLIVEVREAFIVSGLAIALAVLVTIIEKILVNKRTEKTADLCDQIDALFQAGSEHDYLQSIADATAVGASQIEQLKLIVGSLEQLDGSIREQTSSVVEQAVASSTAQEEHLNAINDAITGLNTSVREQTSGVLDRVDQAFAEPVAALMPKLMAQIEQTFGQQLVELQTVTREATSGINDALERMEATVRRLETTASEAREAGGRFAETLTSASGTLEGINELSEASTQTLEQAQEAADRLATSGETLTETLTAAEAALTASRRETEQTDKILEGLTGAAEELSDFTSSLGSDLKKAQQAFSAATAASLDQQSTTFHNDLKEAVGLIHSAIADLGESIESLSRGLEKMRSDVDALMDHASGNGNGASEPAPATGD